MPRISKHGTLGGLIGDSRISGALLTNDLMSLRNLMQRLGCAVILGLSMLLTGCSSDEDRQIACPRPVTVVDASKVTRFAGDGRDLTDVLFEARILSADIVCDLDELTVDATMQVRFAASRGPAERQRRIRFEYFVAISNAAREILLREEFDVDIEFPGNRTEVVALEELTPQIPLGAGERPSDFRVYLGIKLSREEIEFNRRTL